MWEIHLDRTKRIKALHLIGRFDPAVVPYYSAILRITAALKRMICISLWVIIMTEESKVLSREYHRPET